MGLCAMAWWSPECHLPVMAALHVAVSLLLCVTCGCPWGGGPVQARAGAHHPHLALGSGPSGRMSCLGLGPPTWASVFFSWSLVSSPRWAQMGLAGAKRSGLPRPSRV